MPLVGLAVSEGCVRAVESVQNSQSSKILVKPVYIMDGSTLLHMCVILLYRGTGKVGSCVMDSTIW